MSSMFGRSSFRRFCPVLIPLYPCEEFDGARRPRSAMSTSIRSSRDALVVDDDRQPTSAHSSHDRPPRFARGWRSRATAE